MTKDIGGFWRTVGGRRIFIKDGEDLATAMKNSGKFNNEKTKEEALKRTNNIVYMDLIRYFEPDDLEYFKYIRYIEEGKTKNEKTKTCRFRGNRSSWKTHLRNLRTIKSTLWKH